MRYFLFLSFLLSSFAHANWHKVNDADYIWGPFKIYNLALFSENGGYSAEMRPLMLTLKYEKPVDGRDFAISLARSWQSLDIYLPEQEALVDKLKKTIPNLKEDDSLSYIALEDRGYFVLNDSIIPQEFNRDFNNAMLAVWLDPRVEIAQKLFNLEGNNAADKPKDEEKTKKIEIKRTDTPAQQEKILEQEVIPAYDPIPNVVPENTSGLN